MNGNCCVRKRWEGKNVGVVLTVRGGCPENCVLDVLMLCKRRKVRNERTVGVREGKAVKDCWCGVSRLRSEGHGQKLGVVCVSGRCVRKGKERTVGERKFVSTIRSEQVDSN